ncbi:MAG: hypothetical protein P8Y02_08235 [Deinococcales bacterium]
MVERFSGEPVASSPEGTLHWVPDEELPGLPLWPGDRVFLPWLDRPTLFSATLRYQGGAYRGYEVVFYGEGGAVVGRERGGAT